MLKKFNNDYLISKISALMVNNSMTREKWHRRSVCRSQTSTMSFTIRAVKGSPLSRSLILPITSAFPLTGSWEIRAAVRLRQSLLQNSSREPYYAGQRN